MFDSLSPGGTPEGSPEGGRAMTIKVAIIFARKKSVSVISEPLNNHRTSCCQGQARAINIVAICRLSRYQMFNVQMAHAPFTYQ